MNAWINVPALAQASLMYFIQLGGTAHHTPGQHPRDGLAWQVRREVAAEVPGAFIPPIPNWDSNVITPGTAFMAKLAASLREFFRVKLATDASWQHIQARRAPHSQ